MDDDEDIQLSGSHQTTAGGAADEDLSLPKATIHKLINEALPKGLIMTKDTKDLIGDCCLEFVHLLSSESNELCEKESKKTMTGEHVLGALRTLGFVNYIPQVQESLDFFSKSVKDREKKTFRLEDSGLTQEQLLQSQEELFARARQRLQSQAQISPILPVETPDSSHEGRDTENPAQDKSQNNSMDHPKMENESKEEVVHHMDPNIASKDTHHSDSTLIQQQPPQPQLIAPIIYHSQPFPLDDEEDFDA